MTWLVKWIKKSRNFIAKVVDELERTQATLAKQEKIYVTCKKALASKKVRLKLYVWKLTK
jgi:hypothetical protein